MHQNHTFDAQQLPFLAFYPLEHLLILQRIPKVVIPWGGVGWGGMVVGRRRERERERERARA